MLPDDLKDFKAPTKIDAFKIFSDEEVGAILAALVIFCIYADYMGWLA